MGRYTGPKCRLCRREGEKLFLKGERCFSSACAIGRRKQAPGVGMKVRRGRKASIYGQRLREKQKAKRIYRLRERQFRNYVEQAKGLQGVTGDQLILLLERRFDNIVFRAGLATSRDHARQLIGHGLFTVNGSSMDFPSYLVNAGDEILFKASALNKAGIKQVVEGKSPSTVPAWLDRLEGGVRVVEAPRVEEVQHTIRTNMIVEYYSR